MNIDPSSLEASLQIPQCIYHNVELEVDLASERIYGRATLWLAFTKALAPSDQFALHSRVPVSEVLINGRQASFDQRDPLTLLRYNQEATAHRHTCGLDTGFKSALDASLAGELYVRIPDEPLGPIAPLEDLPYDAPKDVREAFSRLQDAYKAIDRTQSHSAEASENLMDIEAIEDGEPGAGFAMLVQVSLRYVIASQSQSQSQSTQGGLRSGVQWHRSAYVATQQQQRRLFRADVAPSAEREVARGAVCVHSSGGGPGTSLRNIDGIRTWTPCVDSPDQRCIFDITVTAPANCAVVCTGRKIKRANVLSPRGGATASSGNQKSLGSWTAVRFATAIRLAPHTVGFFVGSVETYKMSLYRTHGRVLVTTGIVDSAQSDNAQRFNGSLSGAVVASSSSSGHSSLQVSSLTRARSNSQTSNSSDGGKSKSSGSGRKRKGSFSEPKSREAKKKEKDSRSPFSNSEMDTSFHAPSPSITPFASEHKRPRSASIDENSTKEDHADATATPSFNVPVGRASRGSYPAADPGAATQHTGAPLLYEAAIRHSTLGLDMSTRMLHKYSGHLYTNPIYTQIFVHGLGTGHSISFDGFSLIDAGAMHVQEEVAAETPSHLQQMQAYLYSWLLSALPLESADAEFALHGMVGMLMQVYIQEVFGADDAAFRLQSLVDLVVDSDSIGRGGALVSTFPSNYAQVTGHFSKYRLAKSTVLMCLLESRIGGRDSMRRAIQSLLKSSSLYEESLSTAPPEAHRTNDAGGVLTKQQGMESTKTENCLTAQFCSHASGHIIGVTLDSLFAVFAACSSSTSLGTMETFVRHFLLHSGTMLLNFKGTLISSQERVGKSLKLEVNPLHADHNQAVFPMDFTVRITESKDNSASDQVFFFSKNKSPVVVNHQLPNQKTFGKKNASRADQLKDLSDEQREAIRQHELLQNRNRDALDLARAEDFPVKTIIPDPLNRAIFACKMDLPLSCLVELLFRRSDDFDMSTGSDLRSQIMALRSISKIDVIKTQQSLRLLLKAFSGCITGNGIRQVRQLDYNNFEQTRHHSKVRAEAAFCLADWQCRFSRSRDAPTDTLRPLADHMYVDVDSESANMHRAASEEKEFRWIALRTLLKCIRDEYMIASGMVIDSRPEGKPSVTRTEIFKNKENHAGPQQKQKSSTSGPMSATSFIPRSLDLTDENGMYLLSSYLLALSGVRATHGASPRDVIDTLLTFAGHSLDANRHGESLEMLGETTEQDLSHYITVNLVALANVRTEPRSGDNKKDLAAIATHAISCLNRDWAAARTHARIHRAQIQEYDYENDDSCENVAHGEHTECSPDLLANVDTGLDLIARVPLPVFESGGMVTAAALATLVKGDEQILLSNCQKIARLPNRQFDMNLSPTPSSVSPQSLAQRIDYLRYFMPPGVDISDFTAVPTPLDGPDGRFFCICPEIVRLTALECFVRTCFIQHYCYVKKMELLDKAIEAKNKSMAGNSSITEEQTASSRLTNQNVPPTETAFIPTAILAVLQVLNSESSQHHRREACVILHAAIMDIPLLSTRILDGLCANEPLRRLQVHCPHSLSCTATSASLIERFTKENLEFIRSMASDVATDAMSRLYDRLTDRAEDTAVRSVLVEVWMYIFYTKDANEHDCPIFESLKRRVFQDDAENVKSLLNLTEMSVYKPRPAVSRRPMEMYEYARSHLHGGMQGILDKSDFEELDERDEHAKKKKGHRGRHSRSSQKGRHSVQTNQMQDARAANISIAISSQAQPMKVTASSGHATGENRPHGETLRLSLGDRGLDSRGPQRGVNEPEVAKKPFRRISLTL